MYKSSDITWLITDKEGVIPYIVNNQKNKVKIISNDEVIPFDSKETNFIKTSARDAVLNYYGIGLDEWCPGLTTGYIGSYYLNTFQWLTTFRARPSYREDNSFTKTDIKLMKYFIDKNIMKTQKNNNKMQKKKKAKEKVFDKEREF